ncbi:MAG: COG4315 family predicted lipoprotein [Acidimicrobiales bacterium]
MVLAGCGSSHAAVSAGGTTTSTAASSTSTAASSTSTAAADVSVASNAQFGQILVDSSGKTLYTFTGDSAGKIICTGQCAIVWPPLLLSAGQSTPRAGAGVSGLGATTRPDGAHQITIHGLTLYTFVKDTAAGQVHGNGITAFGGTWHVATPTSSASTSASAQAPTTTTPSSTTTTTYVSSYG